MLAVSMDHYGSPDVLQPAQIPKPAPEPTEVLVEVRAAGINPADVKQRAGHGPLSTFPMILGWDVSGVVAEVGFGVTIFSPGDEVYGMPWFPRQAGAYAEYVTAPSRQFAPKPPSRSFAEAAALPLAGLTAWQLVTDTVHLDAGQRLLIHGAAGHVGGLAVQIAKARGAHVIGVVDGSDRDRLRSLGGDEIIDYTTTRFEDVVDPVDAVLDFVGHDYTSRSVPLVHRDGVIVQVPSGTSHEDVRRGADAGVRVTDFLVEPDHSGLLALTDLVEHDQLSAQVAAVVPLAEAARAHALVESGKVKDKVILSTPA
ncbi:NADP-dependent oxidoreductase [Asanoa sp. NPDC049518]|uniref:NADP-dependent oxidoreductase n=1 Tax=unclassified Asanoa TaxID=2685164 RepID=UPI00343B5AFF